MAMAMEIESRLAADSHSLEDYYKAMGTDETGVIADLEREATEQIKSRAVLLAIARAEGIDATDEEYAREVERLSTRYPLSREELERFLQKGGEATAVREDIAIEKASRLVTQLMLRHAPKD